ncbi:MAG: PIN domain-containing protein [Caulobacterales bacterium]|jgi:predicted nucleic acid-binding protein
MRVAIDTNVLIYAEFEPLTPKGARAVNIILRTLRDGVIPVQALGEFLRFAQRRAPTSFDAAINQVALYRTLALTPATSDAVLSAAADLARLHGIQFWDAVICAAALDAGAKALLTEDFQDGRMIDGLRIVNPFLAANDASVDGLIGT